MARACLGPGGQPPAGLAHLSGAAARPMPLPRAAALQAPGGEQAVQLKVAEQVVSAYSRVAADATTTLVVPGNMNEVAGLVASAMQLIKSSKG